MMTFGGLDMGKDWWKMLPREHSPEAFLDGTAAQWCDWLDRCYPFAGVLNEHDPELR